MKYLLFLLTVILLSVGGCATVSEAQQIEPVPVQPDTSVVFGWAGYDYLENGDKLNIWLVMRPSVSTYLETGAEVVLCILGGVVTDKDTQQIMQYQISSMCWWSPSNQRWEAASAWVRWTPVGMVYEHGKITGSFDSQTGRLQQDGGNVFYLEFFRP